MSTASQRLRDEVLLHRIALGRYSTAVVRKVLALLNRVDADLVARIARADNEGHDREQLERLLSELRAIQAGGWTVVRARMGEDIEGLAGVEAEWNGRLLRLTEGVGIAGGVGVPSTEQVVAAANARPFQGRFLRDWLTDAEAGAARRVREAVRQGFVEGQGASEIARRIRGTRALQYRDGLLEISRRGAETMVRTALTHTAAVAAQLTHEANADLLSGVEWVSTLDARTSVICGSLDGRVFPLASGPRPPAHPNCRSTMIPVLRGLEPAGRESYAAWFARQDAETQDGILGRTKARLFREGGLVLERFTDRFGAALTLEQLRTRNASVFTRLGL